MVADVCEIGYFTDADTVRGLVEPEGGQAMVHLARLSPIAAEVGRQSPDAGAEAGGQHRRWRLQ